MAYFPVFIDLQGKTVLIVGGGTQAQQKARRLEPYGAHIRFLDALTPGDLEPAPSMVILAGGERTAWANMCKARNIPVNSVDDIPNCSFYFPSLIKRGDLSIGICSGGAVPAAGMVLRGQLEETLPSNLEAIMPWLAEVTRRLRISFPDSAIRSPILRQITQAAFEKNRPLTESELLEISM